MNVLRPRPRAAAVAASCLCLVGLSACGSSKKSTAATTTAAAGTTVAAATSTTVAGPTGTGTDTGATGTPGRGLSGLVTNVVGNGRDDGAGVPGPADTASLGSRAVFTVSPDGDVFVGNASYRVLKAHDGQVTVVGTLDVSRGPGSGGVAVGPDGSVYVATAQTVTRFSPAGTRSVVVSTSTGGLTSSLGPVAVDGKGNVFVADGARRITRIAPDGSRKLIAGTGTQSTPGTADGDGGPAVKAALGAPSALAFDEKGNLLIADPYARRVRRIDAKGVITTIAGGGKTPLNSQTGAYADDGTKATDLELADVSGLAVDTLGRVYVSDSQSEAIIRFLPGKGIELLAGSQKGGTATLGQPANQTRVTVVTTIALDRSGNLYFLEDRTVRKIADAAAP